MLYQQVFEYLLDSLLILVALLVSAKPQGLFGYVVGYFFIKVIAKGCQKVFWIAGTGTLEPFMKGK